MFDLISSVVELDDEFTTGRRRSIDVHLLDTFIIDNRGREIGVDSRDNEFHLCFTVKFTSA
jgi:hypothetical protein